MSAKKTVLKDGSHGFESSLKRLEEIVQLLEEGHAPLDEVMKMYEEGIMLSRQCLEKLKGAELRLKRLSKDVDGSFKIVEGFEEQ